MVGISSEGCVGCGNGTGEPGVVDDQVAVHTACLAVGVLVEEAEHEGGDGLTGRARGRCCRDGLLDQGRDVEALGRRPADEERVATEAPVRLGDRASSRTSSTRAETGGPPAAS